LDDVVVVVVGQMHFVGLCMTDNNSKTIANVKAVFSTVPSGERAAVLEGPVS